MISVPRTVHGAPQRRQAALGSKPRGHDHAQPRARCGPLQHVATRCNAFTSQRVAAQHSAAHDAATCTIVDMVGARGRVCHVPLCAWMRAL